jgi:hypothetical protein
MRVLIENYRGWEIFFDTDSEDFYTVSSSNDAQQVKKSYASTKKHVDDYIKENQRFKPVKVRKLYGYSEIITITGIRKDGVLVYEDAEGNKGQISRHDESHAYVLANHENGAILTDIDLLAKQKNELADKIDELAARLERLDAKKIRAEFVR